MKTRESSNSRRIPLPKKIENEVLFLNLHTCCICRERNKDVQIHHIDGNSSSNTISNLAVICLDCHSRVTGKRGLGRSYGPGEVRKYKASWEKQVLATRRTNRSIVRYQKELISQIDLMFCEILASPRNGKRIKELLEIIYQLHLWRGSPTINNKILEGLDHLALMSGLFVSPLAGMVAEKLYQLCWHFIGPHEVGMDTKDLKMVLRCLDALGTLARFNCMIGHGHKATDEIAAHVENFLKIGLWYSKLSIVNAAIHIYGQSLKECYEGKKIDFAYGHRKFSLSSRRAFRLLSKEKSGWQAQRRRLQLQFSKD
jgi:hypothetical protein